MVTVALVVALCARAQNPNIVLFFVDDMGWQDTSVPFHTKPTPLNRDYRTPNLEGLASSGVLFTNAYACSVCSPSRVSLMTGKNAARHGVTGWTLRRDTSPEQANPTLLPAPWAVNGLQPIGSGVPRSVESVTLPQLLRDVGYRTIHAGKAHFGAKDTPGAEPRNLGFDVNIAGSYMGGPGSYHGDKSFSATWRGGGAIWDIPGLESYHGQRVNLTDVLTREAIAAVEQSVEDGKPFYLYLSHYAVHAPWEPDRRHIDGYTNPDWSETKRLFASMLEGMDASLGAVRDALDRLGVADNTVIVFMSDNGCPRQLPRNRPLRGHKISAYEGGARVPLIAHWPGHSPPNERCDAPVVIEDLFPTLLEIAGAETVPANDGASFTTWIREPMAAPADRPLFWHYPNLYDQPPYSSVRDGDLKLIYWYETQAFELFDLKRDLSEERDLSQDLPADVERLAALLADHLRATGAPMLVDRATSNRVPYPDDALRTQRPENG